VKPKDMTKSDRVSSKVASEVKVVGNKVAALAGVTRHLTRLIMYNATGSESTGIYITAPAFTDDVKEPEQQYFSCKGRLGGDPKVRKIRGIGEIPLPNLDGKPREAEPPVVQAKPLPKRKFAISRQAEKEFRAKQDAARVLVPYIKKAIGKKTQPGRKSSRARRTK